MDRFVWRVRNGGYFYHTKKTSHGVEGYKEGELFEATEEEVAPQKYKLEKIRSIVSTTKRRGRPPKLQTDMKAPPEDRSM